MPMPYNVMFIALEMKNLIFSCFCKCSCSYSEVLCLLFKRLNLFLFLAFKDFDEQLVSYRMELLRTFLLVIVIRFRFGEFITSFETGTFNDHYPTHSSSELSVISYGHLTFYEKFVSSYQSVVKKQNLTYSVPCKRRNLVPVFLLLCGDVHPCPGPMGSQFASR